MPNILSRKDLISIQDLSLDEIQFLIRGAEKLKKKPHPELLKDVILGSCFFEPSTRTRLSFEAAMFKHGGKSLGFSEPAQTSTKKGESLSDTMRMMAYYSDVIVIRHPHDGAARLAAENSEKPVINAGDGSNQHPTQALLDLFTIHECQKGCSDLKIALVGDLKYGRTVHSLALALSHFNPRLYFVCPDSLAMPDEILESLKEKRLKFSFHQNMEEVLPKLDILYMTRVQKERFSAYEYERVKDSYLLNAPMLCDVKENLKILHPLPRVNELHTDIDETQFAQYFPQAENGIYMRAALIAALTGREV